MKEKASREWMNIHECLLRSFSEVSLQTSGLFLLPLLSAIEKKILRHSSQHEITGFPSERSDSYFFFSIKNWQELTWQILVLIFYSMVFLYPIRFAEQNEIFGESFRLWKGRRKKT